MLDKLISENINKDFFAEKLSLKSETMTKNGKIVSDKGTLTLLKEFFEKYFDSDNEETKEEINKMINTFGSIRKNRTRPAHSIDENTFDQKYFHDQRNLIIEAYDAINILRHLFSKLPNADKCDIPDSIKNGKILTY